MMQTITVKLDIYSPERAEEVADAIRAMLALTAISSEVTTNKGQK